MRTNKLMLACCVLLVNFPGCGGTPQPPAVPGGVPPSAAAQTGAGVAEQGVAPSATGASPTSDALHFVPAQATAVMMKDHRALREFGLPFLLNPGSGFDGRMGGNFADREIELSVLALLGGGRPREVSEANFFSCLQLAPGATAQRLVNAWQLERDDKTYPGFTCYRNAAQPELSYLVVQRGASIAIGTENVLKSRLVAGAPQGPIQKKLEPIAADYDLVVCCLTDYGDLWVAEGYLQPLLSVLDPWLKELKTLPSGAVNALTLALRLEEHPQLLVRVDAADASLASEMTDLFERICERIKKDFEDLRVDLKRELATEGADEIDQFLAGTITGLTVQRNGEQIDVSLPLGKDGAEFKRFVELIQRDGGHPFERSIYAAQRAAERRDPREQLRQIGIAFHNYHDVHDQFPVAISADGKPLLSWRVALLPFLKEGKLFDEFKLDEPWDSAHNRTLVEKLPPIYRDPRTADRGSTTFQVFTGEKTAFSGERFGMANILDGTSNTAMAIQAPPERAVPWTKPEDLSFVVDDPIKALGGIGAEGILAVLFDGQVINVPQKYPVDSWRKIILPADGEAVELPRR
jgi:hypothetical protein